MSELNFAKTFLQTLDAKPTKYPSNHAFDPKTFPTRIPFTLPKLPQPPHPPYPKSTPTAPPPPGATPQSTSTNNITLILKSSRNPSLSLTLKDLNPSTTAITHLRDLIQTELGGTSIVPSTDKIKILYNKKPVPASKKTVADVVNGDLQSNTVVELGVMVIGGAPDPLPKPATTSSPAPPGTTATQPPSQSTLQTTAPDEMQGIEEVSSPPPVQGPFGRAILQTEEFWSDLQGYLEQRVKDQGEAKRLVGMWKNNWEGQR